MNKYDLVVIGCGLAGEKASVKAAYFGHRVAIIGSKPQFGGEGVHSGLASKALKETALFCTFLNRQDFHGIEGIQEMPKSVKQFMYRAKKVIEKQAQEILNNLSLHKVDVYRGVGSFVDAHTVSITTPDGKIQQIQGESMLIATGSHPFHPSHLNFNYERIYDANTILNISELPRTMCIEGSGVIGIEYACIFNAMGVKVYITNFRQKILPFLDLETTKVFLQIIESKGVIFLGDHHVTNVDVPTEENKPLIVNFNDNTQIEVDIFLFASGREGNTAELHCERAGVKIKERQLIEVDSKYRTSCSNIYAVGDVIGGPFQLASTAMDQGRVAVTHIFNTHDFDSLAKLIPCSIYTIPEVAMVGETEETAIAKNIDYFVGRARYQDVPRGEIMACEDGLFKLIFRRENLTLIGVHIVGNIASELLHYGMSLIESKKPLPEIVASIYNYPTLHELYKYACYDALGNLSGHKIKTMADPRQSS